MVGDNVDKFERDYYEVCGQRGRERILFPSSMDWANSDRTCRSYGGHLSVIHSEEEYKILDKQIAPLSKLTEGYCSKYQGVWLGITSQNFNTTTLKVDTELETNLTVPVSYMTKKEIDWSVPWAPDIVNQWREVLTGRLIGSKY